MTRTKLGVEEMESREVPAVLSLSGGVLTFAGDAAADVATVSVASGQITITNSVPFASVPSGWIGAGTMTAKGFASSVSSFVVIGGDGLDTVNLRSCHAPISIAAETVNLCSNAPSNTGSLDLIAGVVDVTATNLTVADFAPATNNSAVVIGESTITELAPSTIIYSVSGLLRVIGSNNAGQAEGYTVTGPGSALKLDTNAGNDSVFISSTAYALTLNTGNGDDAVSIGDDLGLILGAIAIDLGSGANVLTLDDSATSHAVTMTSTKISGFAPADITYKAVGGTITANLYCSVPSTIHFGTMPSTTMVNLFGDWTVI